MTARGGGVHTARAERAPGALGATALRGPCARPCRSPRRTVAVRRIPRVQLVGRAAHAQPRLLDQLVQEHKAEGACAMHGAQLPCRQLPEYTLATA